MPRVEFEGIKINLNSMLLMTQLVAAVLFVGVSWSAKDTLPQTNTAQILELRGQLIDVRAEVRDMRQTNSTIAGLRADMENVKASVARVEHKLDDWRPIKN